MKPSILLICFLFLPGSFHTPGSHVPMGFELRETKEELGLQYDVAVTDHDTGRVTLVFTLKNEGRLKPVKSVDLYVPSKQKHVSGGTKADLSLSLELRQVDDKQIARVHISKELASQAELRIKTYHLDGKQEALTWYYHRIPFKDYPAKKQFDDPPTANDAKSDWDGKWQTNWGSMQLKSNGKGQLSGTYGSLHHSIDGAFDPEHPEFFSGTWIHSDSRMSGRFQLRMKAANQFEGSWTYGDQNPSGQTINWTGERSEPAATE